MDWSSSSRTNRFTYERVDAATLKATERLDGVFLGGGTIEENHLTAIKASGSLPFVSVPEVGNDLLRVSVTSSLWDEGETVALGTFVASATSADIGRGYQVGTVELYSVLQLLADGGIDEPVTIPAGTEVVPCVGAMVRSVGLGCTSDDSASTLTRNATFDAGTPKLTVINELLGYCGFSSAGIDAYGGVVLRRYHDPSALTPTVTFEDGARCTFAPLVRHELDIRTVPNVLVVVLNAADASMSAIARNTDPMSRYSIPRRGGREVTATETVSDIESQAALDALAERRLADLSSAVESVEVTHVWQPFGTGEAGRLVYAAGGVDFTGVAVRRTLTLTQDMPCTTRFRRFVRL